MVSKKVSGLALSLILVLSFCCVWFVTEPSQTSVKAEESALILNVLPEGDAFHLGVNEDKVFTATAINGSGSYGFTWVIEPTGSFKLRINDKETQLYNGRVVESVGSTLKLSFPGACENEYVMVYCRVVDSDGHVAQSRSFMVTDPYTSPGLKFDASPASASIIVQADAKGWYRGVNGTTMALISSLSSTNPNTTINGALTAATGKTVYITAGAYTDAVLDVPASTNLIADAGVTGISYSSIGAGARIDEPVFNAAFGGYSSGSYTIVTNQTASAFASTQYLAFKPDNSISWTSTNKTFTIDSALTSCGTGGTVYVNSGDYSSTTVEVPNGVRLELSKGAIGITYSAAASATCAIVDWQVGNIDYYYEGAKTAYIDFASNNASFSPAVVWDEDWNATVEDVVDAYSSIAWKSGWNATVENIVETLFSTQGWSSNWDDDVNSLIGAASISWAQITNANATVQQIVDAYSSMAWKDGWNTTVADIATSNLGTLTSLIVSGTASFGNATLTSGIFPSGMDYIVYKEGSTYYAKHANGTIVSSSASGTTVIDAVENTGISIGILGTIEGRAIITHSNVKLIGVGSGATLKLPAGADDDVVDITGAGVVNVQVLNLLIDGNKANNAAGDGIYCDTDYVSTDTGHVFQNLRIIGTSGDGIDLVADSRVCMLDNIYVGGNSGDAPEGRGFNLAGTDHHGTNLEVGFAEKSGFFIKTTNGKFTNCKAFACGSDNDANDNAGFILIGANSGCYNSLTNCHAQDNKYTGFLLYNGARDNVFINCHSDDNGQTSDSPGFKLDTACVRNKLVGCYVFDYAGTHMTMGLVIGTDCDYNTVVGNEFWNGQNDGVYISGGDYNYIQGNTINGFTKACINIVSGTGNRVLENNFVDVGTDVLADGGTATEVNEVYSFPERGTDLNFVGSYSGRYFDASGDEAFFSFYVPSSASEVLSVKVMVVANGTGTYRLNFSSEFGANTEDSDTHTDSLADVDVACTADYIHAYDVTTCFTGLAAGDYAGMRVFGDTSNTAQLLVIQVVVRYV